VNGDGRPDIVTPNAYAGTVSVLVNGGGGTFPTRRSYSVGRAPHSLAIGDLNGDGKPDLAVTGSDIKAPVLLNRGDGTFGPESGSATGDFVAIGDLNGDGANDLVGACFWMLCVRLGSGHGDFEPTRDYATVGISPFLVLGDLNGDHRPDVVDTFYSGGLAVHLNRGR
jgi:hypothetical protein